MRENKSNKEGKKWRLKTKPNEQGWKNEKTDNKPSKQEKKRKI